VEKDDNPAKTAVLLYFCNNRERLEESCLNILRTFIFQYTWAEKSNFSRLTERCGSLATWDPFNASDFKLSFNVLWDVFSTILDTTTKAHIYCIIDAVDECAQDDTTSEFIRRLMTRPKRRDGAAVKLLISGRPDWQRESGILRDFSTKKPLEVRLEPELTSHDITQIVDAGFAGFEEKLSIDRHEVVQLKQKLVTKANGMVLWAVLALREIKKKLGITLGWLRRVVDSLPSGVSEIYDRILRSLQHKYDCYEGDDKEPLLGNPKDGDGSESGMLLIWKAMLWVARAGRALTLRELEIALSVHLDDTRFAGSQPRRIANIEDFVRRIPFFEVVPPPDKVGDSSPNCDNVEWRDLPSQTMTSSATVRLIHQSAKNYILKARVLQGGKQQGPLVRGVFNLDDADIAAALVTVLKFSDFENGPAREFPGSDERFGAAFQAHIEGFGLLEYAASYWCYHMRRVADPSDRLISLVDSFAARAHNNVRFWCQVSNFLLIGHTDFVDNFFGLHVVAWKGVDSMVRFYIAQGDKPDERDQYGRTPYMMAVFNDHHTTAKILEDAGADTDLTFGVNRFNLVLSALQEASSGGDSQAVAELLEEGHLVDEADKYGRTSLFYAGQAGDWETVDVLLRASADPLAKDIHGRHPLDVTFDAQCRDVLG